MGDFDSGTSTTSSGVTAESPSASGSSSASTESQPSLGQAEGSHSVNTALPKHESHIPYERFREVNERMKASEQAAQRWAQVQQQYGELADPQTYQNAVTLFNQLRQDPVTVVTQLLSELSAHEQYRPMVASQAAKVLNGLRGPKEEPEPQPDLMADNGMPVYSAQQQRAWQEWQQRKLRAEFEAQLSQATAPLKQMQQERAVLQVRQQAEQVANQMYERASQWHGFKQHEADIAKAMTEHTDWSLQDAYLHVLHTRILPTLPAQAQAQVVADLQQKAAAQSLSPAGATRTAEPKFGGDDFLKALQFHAQRVQRR